MSSLGVRSIGVMGGGSRSPLAMSVLAMAQLRPDVCALRAHVAESFMRLFFFSRFFVF